MFRRRLESISEIGQISDIREKSDERAERGSHTDCAGRGGQLISPAKHGDDRAKVGLCGNGKSDIDCGGRERLHQNGLLREDSACGDAVGRLTGRNEDAFAIFYDYIFGH